MARTCYYELLGVERSATDADLKRAYRKQALVWHPDKNHTNAEEATEIFAQIREAYEMLSDPQERAWYDNHREQILRGDEFGVTAAPNDGNQSANVDYTSTETLMRHFSVSSFRGFDDSPAGFFAVYRKLFENLRDEELQIYDPDSEERLDMIYNLDFGDSHTLYDEDAEYARSQGKKRNTSRRDASGTTLRDFYNFWTTFSTRKSFGWFDKYRLADAENRQIRRLMEKENKHLREKARREFVDTVQNLAAWLKKRDPRYKAFVEEQRVLQEERERDRKRRVAEQRAALVDDASTYVRQAWEEVDYSNHLDEYLSELSDAEKAHSDADGQEPDDDGAERDLSEGDVLDPENDLLCITCDKEFKTPAQKANHEKSKKHQRAVREIRREMMREERRLAKMQTNGDIPSSAASNNVSDNESFATPPESPVESAEEPDLEEEEEANEDDVLAQMIRNLSTAQASGGKKNKKKKRKNQIKAQPTDDASDLENPPSEPAEPESAPDSADPESALDSPAAPRVSKKELRKERQKKKELAELKCNVCSKDFASRNQLFDHIKDTGHALANNLPKHLAESIMQERAAKGKKGKKSKK
ncbi:DnaJ-domain-containing protein [Linderina pennispora]|uniref:DnaJ-domain-containing protein n=1 Tax=Linderina pennispora TaxID=61395 RepID=A0A1Y1WFT5_9FUNG|nr:DnaJ-domain-containing protein [Linderina pennispora]ORX72188.1 DnaJ-domain-containing protein [Linderina pennispora]